MENLPAGRPTGHPDLLGMVLDGLLNQVRNAPFIGDIVRFVEALFGRASTSNTRLTRLEAIVSKGASGSDLFNRVNSSTLGTGPGMPGAWVQGGDGQGLGIVGNAARLLESVAPAQGRRWARYPLVATTSTMTVNLGVDDRPLSPDDLTTAIVCANEAFTEGIAANIFGIGVYLARFARSGNTWTFTDFASDTGYKIERTQSIELRASGTGSYSLWIENQRIIGGDSDLPVDAAHRWGGFAIRMSIPAPFVYRYGWGVTVFSLRSEAADTFTAIETATTIAQGAATTATEAVTAVGTVVEDATAAATSAAEAAAAAIGAEQASSVESAKAAIISIQSGMPVQAGSHSPLNHECTFDWEDLALPSGVTLSGGVSNTSGSWSQHRHANGTSQTANTTLDPHGHSDNFSAAFNTNVPKYTPPANTIEWGLVRSRWTGQRGAISYAIDHIAASVNPLFLYIASMSPVDGKVTVQHVSADQASTISASGGQLYNMPDEIRALFTVGDWMWLGLHQPGSQQRRPIYYRPLPAIPLQGALFPSQTKASLAATAALTAGTVIDPSSFSFATYQKPFLGIGQPAILPIPDPTKFFEGFESGSIPATIVKRSGNAKVTNGVFVQNSTSNGVSLYQITEKLNRSDHEVSGQVRAPGPRFQYLGLRDGGSGFSSRVELGVNASTIRIEQNGFFASGVLASQAMSVADGDVFKIRADLNVYTVFKLTGSGVWTSVLVYTDSSNALPRGAANRSCTIATSWDNFNTSGGWDYILCQDKPDEGWAA